MTYTPEQIDHGRYLAVVMDNPIRPGEGSITYCHRICVIVGSVKDDEGIANREWTPAVRLVAQPEREVRLPYKDPPDVEEVDPYADIQCPF